MIIVLGGSGYVGGAIVRQLEMNSIPHRVVSRGDCNYYLAGHLSRQLREWNATFLINAAGFTGRPNVDACELQKSECLLGNAVLPGILRSECEAAGIPWGHVSSGCIFTGDKGNQIGFTEADEPNFSFRQDNCSFYSGSKALGEECLVSAENVYVWRLRIPFNHQDGGRNYLSKLLRYEWLLEARNSISHLDDFARVCLESWNRRIPFGIYNVTNSGSITTREIVDLIQSHLKPDREFRFFDSEESFMQKAAKTPRSNCVMDNAKLLDTGIPLESVEDAIVRSLTQWQWEGATV